MKTKYKKVSVSDRLPEKEGLHSTDLGTLLFYENAERLECFKNIRNEEIIAKSRINWWLEEVPDYEEEMREMLEFIYGYGEKVEWSKVRPQLEELLTKLKHQ